MKELIKYDGSTYTLYAHINRVNKKVYFGITKMRPEARWKNGNGYEGYKFGRAINKYGWNSFIHIVILSGLTNFMASWLEEAFISYYRSNTDKFGYNTDKGGKTGMLSAQARRLKREQKVLQPFICLETKRVYEDISEFEGETGRDESYIKSVCPTKGTATHRGQHYLYLKDYQQLSKKEIQDIILGEKENHHKVVCLETGEVFWNATEAEKTIPYGQACVSKRCRTFQQTGQGNKTGDRHWVFIEDYEGLNRRKIEDIIFQDCTKVIRLDTLKTYESMKEAAACIGVDDKAIKRCCIGELKHVNGINWMYYKEYRDKEVKKLGHSLICLETKEIFSSYKAAGESYNESWESIRKACYKKENSLKRLHWMLIADYAFMESYRIEAIIKNREGKRLMMCAAPVICLETQEVFQSAKEAQKQYSSTSEGCIITCCRRSDPNRLTAAKKHWMYKEEYDQVSPDFIESILGTKRGLKISKSVVKLETGEVFSSIEEASHKCSISCKTIRYSCTGQRKTMNKSGHWKFKKDYDIMSEDEKNYWKKK